MPLGVLSDLPAIVFRAATRRSSRRSRRFSAGGVSWKAPAIVAASTATVAPQPGARRRVRARSSPAVSSARRSPR